MKTKLARVLLVAGFIAAIGTVGAADSESIGLTQIVIQLVLSGAAIITGFALGHFDDYKRD